MRALRAARAVDRVSHAAITVAGVLCGALVFFVAIPLALSNPFPSPKTENWAVNRASFRVASLIPMSIAVEQEALLEPAPAMPESEPTLWDFVALPLQQASLGFVRPPTSSPTLLARRGKPRRRWKMSTTISGKSISGRLPSEIRPAISPGRIRPRPSAFASRFGLT